MKHVFTIVCAVVAASVATGLAWSAEKPAWKEWKAEQVVTRNAHVSLPAEDRAALEAELRRELARYRALGMTGEIGEDPALHAMAARYARALAKVRGGLDVDDAECVGTDSVSQSGRYSVFRCAVSTEPLEIPSASLVVSDSGISVSEGEPRSIAPIEAELNVRVTGKSSFAFWQV